MGASRVGNMDGGLSFLFNLFHTLLKVVSLTKMMGQHETTDDDEWVGMGVENGFTTLL